MAKIEIPELKEKLDFLLGHQTPRRIAQKTTGCQIKSRPDMARAIGLKSHSNLYSAHGGLSDRVEEGIRRIYMIELDSECWGEFAVGSADEFVSEFLALHLEPTQLSQSDAAPPQQAEMALEVDRAAQVRRETHPLASLVLFTHQPGPGEALPVSFELCCNPDEDEFDNVAVKRGRLTIDTGSAELDPQSRPGFAEAAAYQASQGRVSFSWNGPARDGYVWKVAAEGDYIGNVGTPLDDGFCNVCGLQPGGVITARFEIVLKDLTHRPEESGLSDNRQLPIVRLGVEGLGEAKEWIVRRIKELALSDDDGRVLLAEHIIPFKARNSSGGENEAQ